MLDESADERGGHCGSDRDGPHLLRRDDEDKLGRAFHPRACIVGHEHGGLSWSTLDDFVAECQAVTDAGPHEWRIEVLLLVGDTALVRLGGQFAGVWYSDDLSMLRIDDTWRIVHKTFYAHPGT